MSNLLNISAANTNVVTLTKSTSNVSPELASHFKSAMAQENTNEPIESQQKHGWGACLKKADLELGAKLAKKKWPNGAPRTKLSEDAIKKIIYNPTVDGKAKIMSDNFITDEDEYIEYAKKNGRQNFINAGGNPDSIEEGIRIYAQSPMGKKVLTNLVNSKHVLNIYAGKGASGSGHKIEHSGNGPFTAYALAHEFGHTVFSPGGPRWDHHNPDYSKSKRINNVAIHDNEFRKFIGMPARGCYTEKIKGNWGYGQTFDENGTKIK